ncbi:MAG: hypothetical protein U0169_18525 [Polyangiaceae bacterium]
MRDDQTLRAAVLLVTLGVFGVVSQACATGVGPDDVDIPTETPGATGDAGGSPTRPTEGNANGQSGTKKDAGASAKDAAVDAEPAVEDAGNQREANADSGPVDAGSSPVDAGRADTGSTVADAGSPRDAGTVIDAGSPVDAGNPVPDSGTPVDSGSTSGTPCLLFSEYLEGDSNDKAIEIWNCGTTTLDLATTGLCLVSNQDTRCSTTAMLSGVLPAGEVRTVCAAGFSNSSKCDATSAVANFNGDDRLVLFRDEDVSGTFGRSVDEVWDAFGETTQRPSGTPWAEKGFRRNTCASYDGVGTFTASSRYSTHASSDLSNLKVAPQVVCP